MANRSGPGPISIALVGTRGVPARYGGFETCVEEVGRRLADKGHDVVVYCRPVGQERPDRHFGMRLIHLPALRRRSLETLSHTALSVAHLVTHPVDAAIVFNCANAPFLPVLRARGVPFATHVDGLEWQRAKWGPVGRRYYKAAERMSVYFSHALIADAVGIADHYRDTYGAATELISYGAPITSKGADRLTEVDLGPDAYHLVVARFEPENHVLDIVKGYASSRAELPLVVVGAAPYAHDYTAAVRSAADARVGFPPVRFLGAVWDQQLLDQLYGNARTYLHGHSVGGTNPSLLRALGAGAPTDAYDVVFNREVLGGAGRYFRTSAQVADLLEDAEANPTAAYQRGRAALSEAGRFDWDDVANRYESLCQRLAGPRTR